MSEEIPAVGELQIGKTYSRPALHDRYGGNRYTAISPCADHPYVFVFTKPSRGEWSHEFRGETFVYTGEGTEGDMEMTGGNEAIRTHSQAGRELHVFDTLENDDISYLGAFECRDWFRTQLPDKNGEQREAIRFELEPAPKIGQVEWVDL